MNELKWSLEDEKRTCTLRFLNPAIEEMYLALRRNRILILVPKLLMLVLCSGVILRRVQLLGVASSGGGKTRFADELRTFSISASALLLELTTHFCNRLSAFRCVLLTLLSFYTAADGSITYYIGRVKDEPLYAFGYHVLVYYHSSFQMAGITPIICSLLCYSWISSS